MATETTKGGNGERGEGKTFSRALDVESRADDLVRSVRDLATDVQDGVRREVRRSPYRTLGLGALAGFVLGGGLSPAVMRIALGVGGRLLMASVLEKLVREAE